VKRFTSDDRNDKSRGFAPAERNVEGEPVGPSFEGVVGEGTLSRRRMLGLAGGALTGLLLTPLTLSGGEASATHPVLPSGTYTIRQRLIINGTRRYLDAYNYAVAMYGGDYRAVTRDRQGGVQVDASQRWLIERFGAHPYWYFIRQQLFINGTRRYLDAHETSSKDYAVMTTRTQETGTQADSQRWLIVRSSTFPYYYRIRQKSTGRYLDAFVTEPNDYAAMTRDPQNNDTQRWLLTRV
jgi:hypothetical protein